MFCARDHRTELADLCTYMPGARPHMSKGAHRCPLQMQSQCRRFPRNHGIRGELMRVERCRMGSSASTITPAPLNSLF
eukprot:354809-Pelagomonas_calceolata.AAC.8